MGSGATSVPRCDQRGQVAAGIPVPHALLDAPFPPERKLRYFVEDGNVLDYDPYVFRDRKNQNDGA
jgi:hypothetical protein